MGADGRLGAWTSVASDIPSLYSMAGATDGRYVWLVGGQRDNDAFAYDKRVIYVDLEDPAYRFIETTALHVGRRRLAVAKIGDLLVATGGLDDQADASTRTFVSTAKIIDGGELSPWELGPTLPKPVYDHASASIGDRLITIACSELANPTNEVREPQIADAEAVGWNTIASVPMSLTQERVVVAGDQLFALGGSSTTGAVGP